MKITKLKIEYSTIEERNFDINDKLYEGYVIIKIYGNLSSDIPLTVEYEWRE